MGVLGVIMLQEVSQLSVDGHHCLSSLLHGLADQPHQAVIEATNESLDVIADTDLDIADRFGQTVGNLTPALTDVLEGQFVIQFCQGKRSALKIMLFMFRHTTMIIMKCSI